MATDAEATAAGYAVPANDMLISAIPGALRQNARTAALGAWIMPTVNSAFIKNQSDPAPPFRVRLTPAGLQLGGAQYRASATIASGTVMCTLPTSHRPPFTQWFHAAGTDLGLASPNGPGKAWVFRVDPDGQISNVDTIRTNCYWQFNTTLTW